MIPFVLLSQVNSAEHAKNVNVTAVLDFRIFRITFGSAEHSADVCVCCFLKKMSLALHQTHFKYVVIIGYLLDVLFSNTVTSMMIPMTMKILSMPIPIYFKFAINSNG